MSRTTIRKAMSDWQRSLDGWYLATQEAACRGRPCAAHRIVAHRLGSSEDARDFDRVCREVRAIFRGCPYDSPCARRRPHH